MTTRTKKILTSLLILLPVAVMMVPQGVWAEGSMWTFFQGISLWDFWYKFLALLANTSMTLASWYLATCGILLNGAMTATLHIKELVGGSDSVISTTWTTLRDLSSIGIIFMLLWSAIQMIIDVKGPKFGELVKSIVMVGLLINFSLFFTNIAVDASNLVSLAFYRAITPEYSQNTTVVTVKGMMDGGISNVFMQSLQIQKLYEPSKQLKGTNVSLNIIIAGIGGTVLMIIAGTSFIFASFAFLIRIGIIILLMIFSPVYFIGWIIPEVSSYSKKWLDQLKAQCLFMPTYMIFLYVAMRVISNEKFMNFLNPSSAGIAANPNGTTGIPDIPFVGSLTGVILQYVVAILMINLPLIIAMDVGKGGLSLDFAKKFVDTKKINSFIGSTVGTNTAGRAGQYLEDKFGKPNNRFTAAIRGMTTGAAASGTYSGTKTHKQKQDDWDKTSRQFDSNREENKRKNVLDAYSKQTFVDRDSTSKAYKSAIEKMKESERVDLDKKHLMNINVLKWLKSSDFEAIKKSGKYSDKDMKEITRLRYLALTDAVEGDETNVIKFMVSNMTGEELAKTTSYDSAEMKVGSKNTKNLLAENSIIDNLKESQLTNMVDKIDDDNIRRGVRERVMSGLPGGKIHPALKYMNSDRSGGWQT